MHVNNTFVLVFDPKINSLRPLNNILNFRLFSAIYFIFKNKRTIQKKKKKFRNEEFRVFLVLRKEIKEVSFVCNMYVHEALK